jgi:putative nucleotidyltransferase with HDIG domain
MPTALKTYFAVVILAALVFCATVDWSILGLLTSNDWLGLATFLALAVLSQVLAVDSTLGASKPVKSSITFLPLLALAVVLPVPAVIIAAGSTTTIHELFFRERSWPRALFNTSQTILSYGLAATVFQSLSPTADTTSTVLGGGLTDVFLPFYALAFTFFILNVLFISGVLAIRQGERFWNVVMEAFGAGGGNLLYDLLASPVALFAAYLYESLYVGGLLAAVLPIMLIRHSYLSAIQLKQANQDLLNVLVKAIETRDPYTSGHSLRVSTLAKLIAADLGVRPPTIANIERAALLHDIGKIDALYANIISKPTGLTEQERLVIQTHATKGADLLESLTSLEKAVIAGVRYHHEMYDGSGYPEGLSGKDIPLAARIIMICDAVDAMLSDRPYRDALSVEAVRQELLRCSGTQFDPDIVQVILEHNTLERAEFLVDRSGARTNVRAIVG